MYKKYIKKLIKNIPIDTCENYQCIDLILDGGSFNGSYLIGALYFLKEMERKSILKIDKISGVSIGSLSAFLYHIDALHIIDEIYKKGVYKLKKHTNFNIFDIFDDIFNKIKPLIKDDICETMRNRIYITYYNANTCKKIVKSKFKNIDDIFETIKRSCFIPYVIDGNITWRDKYIDGINPYIFKQTVNKRILHINLIGYDKIFNTLSIKNEKSNTHRILHGLLDIHLFFIKKQNTIMCRYIENGDLYYNLLNMIRCIFELYIIYSVYFYIILKKWINSHKEINEIINTTIFKNCLHILSNFHSKIIKYIFFQL